MGPATHGGGGKHAARASSKQAASSGYSSQGALDLTYSKSKFRPPRSSVWLVACCFVYSAHLGSGLQARCRDWAVDWPHSRGGGAPASSESKQQASSKQRIQQPKGALNFDPLARLACCFVQCASREWAASAFRDWAVDWPTHGRGGESASKQAARASSKQQASSKQRIQQSRRSKSKFRPPRSSVWLAALCSAHLGTREWTASAFRDWAVDWPTHGGGGATASTCGRDVGLSANS
jgi:hypothetical protein